MGRRERELNSECLSWISKCTDLETSRNEWKRLHDRNLDEWLKDSELSQKRFEGWTREYNKRKALEQEVAAYKLLEDNSRNHYVQDRFRIDFLETENQYLEGENRDLCTRILDLTKKLTAAEDLTCSLQTQLSYYKPVWYTKA